VMPPHFWIARQTGPVALFEGIPAKARGKWLALGLMTLAATELSVD
jgi:hypothetical protein